MVGLITLLLELIFVVGLWRTFFVVRWFLVLGFGKFEAWWKLSDAEVYHEIR